MNDLLETPFVLCFLIGRYYTIISWLMVGRLGRCDLNSNINEEVFE